jgi:ribose transport system permease protein
MSFVPKNAAKAISPWRKVGRILNLPPSVYVVAVLVALSAYLVPVLTKLPFQMVILRQAAPIGLVVCAQLLVMRTKSIDLSVGGVFILMNYLVTSSTFSSLPPAVALTAPMLAAILVGAINGLFIAWLRASAVVVTLAMGAILLGIVLFLSSGRPPGSAGEFVRFLGVGKVGIIPVAVALWLVVAILVDIFLRRSVYGRFVNVIGSNPTAASLSGVPVIKTMFLSHVFAAALAGLGGILLAGYIGMGSVKIGTDIVMTSIAGVILGGITFGGGRKSIFGAMLAAYALAYIFNLMTALKFGEPSKLIVQGVVIFAASAISSFNEKHS